MTDIEARREARRRKILENPEKRLQKITGVQQRNVSYELEGYRSSQIAHEENSDNFIDQSLPIRESSNSDLLNSHPQTNSLLNPSTGGTNSTFNKLFFFKAYRVHIITLIAFSVNILLWFYENNDSHFVNKIFIPILCFEAVDLFYSPNEANNDLAKYLIFFKNIPRYQLSRIIRYLVIIKTIFRDVMVYFFIFACILYFKLFTNILCKHFVL